MVWLWAVAVKKPSSVVQDSNKEFKNEVQAIRQAHRKNLVRLLGYCDDGENRLLVYEFLRKFSLWELETKLEQKKANWFRDSKRAICMKSVGLRLSIVI